MNESMKAHPSTEVFLHQLVVDSKLSKELSVQSDHPVPAKIIFRLREPLVDVLLSTYAHPEEVLALSHAFAGVTGIHSVGVITDAYSFRVPSGASDDATAEAMRILEEDFHGSCQKAYEAGHPMAVEAMMVVAVGQDGDLWADMLVYEIKDGELIWEQMSREVGAPAIHREGQHDGEGPLPVMMRSVVGARETLRGLPERGIAPSEVIDEIIEALEREEDRDVLVVGALRAMLVSLRRKGDVVMLMRPIRNDDDEAFAWVQKIGAQIEDMGTRYQ